MNSHEKAFFFGGRGNRRYAVLHTPDSENRGGIGWVLCSPIGEEHNFAHRTLVELARELCRHGHHVLRFDYRGHGDSDGSFEFFAVDDYVQDVVAAASELEAQTGVACRGLWGLRTGAAFAVQAAAIRGNNPLLILCDPVVHGSQYLDEQLRTILASQVFSPEGPGIREETQKKLDSGELVFVQGRPFSNHLWQSLYAVNLNAVDCPTQNPILITEASVRPGKPPKNEYQALAALWGDRTQVSVQVLESPALHAGQVNRTYNDRVRPRQLFDATLRWVAETSRHFHAAATASRRENPADDLLESGERPVEFLSDGNRISGILHLPQNTNRNAAVIIAPHALSRTGYNRLYVKIARGLAAQGWVVLRFDGHGLGDSDGSLDFATGSDLFLSVESGMQLGDTVAAMDYIQREMNIDQFVIAGACGGAVTSVYAAATDDRVVGIAPMEMSLRYYAPIEKAEAPPLWFYRHKLFSLESWRRVFTFQADFRTHIRWAKQVAQRLVLQGCNADDRHQLESRIGSNVNFDLISALRKCSQRGVPLLFVFGSTPNADYFANGRQTVFRQPSVQVVDHVISGADHNFSLPQHTAILIDVLANWLGVSTGFQQ